MIATVLLALSLGTGALRCPPPFRGPDGPFWLPPLLMGALTAVCALAGAGLSLATGGWCLNSAHALSFVVLSFAGGRMLLEAVGPAEEPRCRCGCRGLACGAVDALLAGFTLPLLSGNLWAAVGLVGGVTLLLYALSALLSEREQRRLYAWLSAAGGLSLTCIGMHLLLRTLL